MSRHTLAYDVELSAKQFANNHQSFDSFGWHDAPADREKWGVYHTENRDSGLLEQSNAATMDEILAPFIESGDIVPQHFGHWGVGWIDGLAIRVYDDNGEITPAYRAFVEIQESLSDYPVLDEEDYSRREYESAIEAIGQQAPAEKDDVFPDDWKEQVFSWLWDNDQHELENHDDNGAFPSEESVRAACLALEFFEEPDESVGEIFPGDTV